MSKINVLDSSIFNRIAAGEVVENPRSIVKELMENSIDAGAKSITVEIKGGGIEYVSVSDDGSGINKEDMPIAFMPHATSKIREIKDLDAITTLGFRGEALPSIAAVANVEMLSRTQNSELGYFVKFTDGKLSNEGECGAPLGTKVTVTNLFKNIPARAKFLSKPQTEEGLITEFVAKMILANPFLKIKYVINGQTKYQSDGNGIQSAIYLIYGSEFLKNTVEINYAAQDMLLTGFICRPDYTKHNRTYQTLIVNGRYIINSEISYCIQQCYRDYLMKRQFPAYVLYLNLPTDMIDVNVHPNKLDVRFSGEKRLKGIIYNTVKAKIDELAKMPTEFTVNAFNVFSQDNAEEESNIIVEGTPHKAEDGETDLIPLYVSPKHEFFNPNIPVIMREAGFIRNNSNEISKNYAQNRVIDPYGYTKNTRREEFINGVADQIFGSETNIKYAGKLFNTYILVESGNDFYLIDQHAAHERIIYEKLLKQLDEQEVATQELLVPYIFELSPQESALLNENLNKINGYGFKIEKLSGNSYSLFAVPVSCSRLDLKTFVEKLTQDVYSAKTPAHFIKENLMQAACKSAIKGEDDLKKEEIESLIRQMQETDTAKFCPHGRPTVIKFTKAELEKLFKRTV